jgi:hypothetical protein
LHSNEIYKDVKISLAYGRNGWYDKYNSIGNGSDNSSDNAFGSVISSGKFYYRRITK